MIQLSLLNIFVPIIKYSLKYLQKEQYKVIKAKSSKNS